MIIVRHIKAISTTTNTNTTATSYLVTTNIPQSNRVL